VVVSKGHQPKAMATRVDSTTNESTHIVGRAPGMRGEVTLCVWWT